MFLKLIPTLQNKVLKRGTNHGGLLLSFASRALPFAQNEIASAELAIGMQVNAGKLITLTFTDVDTLEAKPKYHGKL